MAKAIILFSEKDVACVPEVLAHSKKHVMPEREFRVILGRKPSPETDMPEHVVNFSNGIRVSFALEFQTVGETSIVHRHIVISSNEELTPIAVNMVLSMFEFEGSLGAIPLVLFKAWIEFIDKENKFTLHIVEPVRGWDGCPDEDEGPKAP